MNEDYLKGLIQSMGVSACEPGALDALKLIAEDETNKVVAMAAKIATQLHQPVVGPEAMKLACDSHMLLQPPIRERTLETARAHNSRAQVWPLGASVLVPAHQAAAAAAIAPGAVIENTALRIGGNVGSGIAIGSSSSGRGSGPTEIQRLPQPDGALPASVLRPVTLKPAGGKGSKAKASSSSSAAAAAGSSFSVETG